MVKEVQISLATVHYFAIFFNKNDHEIELVVLHTINPVNSTKWVTPFSWIFHFSLIGCSKKIFDIFFSQMPDASGVNGTIFKVKREDNLFWVDSPLPSQNARTKVRLL